jgi:GT2 family glycosyltransferase
MEIIINDDGSTDSSRTILQQYEEMQLDSLHFIILHNEKNFGFSTTVNRGVAKASGDIVVLLNNDVLPDDDFLAPLIKHFSDPKMFAVGCMDKSIEKEGTVLRGRGVGRWDKGFLMHQKGDIEGTQTLWVSGGSGAFRRKYWEALGGLQEMMNPFYWEDIDLSYRAWKAGYCLVFEKNSTVIHEHEEGAIKKTSTPKKVRVTSYRNQFYFVWINVSDTSLVLMHLFWLPYHLVRAVLHRDASFITGFLTALKNLPTVLKQRKMVQKLVTVTDADVIRPFAISRDSE